MLFSIAIFGEAKKGPFNTFLLIHSLIELEQHLGNPPKDSLGLHFAIQALLYDEKLLFFRVKEEGFSFEDYYLGLKLLQDKTKIKKFDALCLPGVGEKEIINTSCDICRKNKSILIMSEKDLYDYLTSS